METTNTKDRLLDAAERLFGSHGFGGTSLRKVTAEAGANLAAVHYHFGSKEALLRATAARRIEPVNRERIRLLDEIEARVPSGKLPLEPILDAFFRPALLLEATSPAERAPLRQLAAVIHSEPAEVVQPLVAELFGEIARRFVGALERALPHLSGEDVALRLQFSVGLMVHALSQHFADVHQPDLPALPRDGERLLQAMIAFAAAGLRAPASPKRWEAPAGEGPA